MSPALTQRRAPAAAAVTLPQVNLLPSTVRDKRALGRVKRMLAFSLVGVVGLVGVGFFGATQVQSAAQSRLDAAQDETIELVREKNEYTEAPKVLGQVNALQGALAQGFSTDISWQPYIAAVLAVMPEGVRLRNIDMTAGTPMLMPALPASPLQAPSVATLTFIGDSPTAVDTGAWIDALNSIPGFSDAWVQSGELTADDGEGEDKTPYYSINSSVQINTEAFTRRFAEAGE